MSRGGREGRPYRRKVRQVREAAKVCPLCGRPIDPGLRFPDPYSASADHLDPIAKGGDPMGPMVGVHLICNIRRRTGDRVDVDYLAPPPGKHTKRRTSPRAPKHSTDW